MIVTFLSSSIQAFLTRHGFLSLTNARQYESGGSPSPRKRRKTNYEGDSGYGEEIEACQAEPKLQARSIATKGTTGLCLSEIVCISVDVSDMILILRQMSENQEEIAWTDPRTGEAFIVNTRTGNSRFTEQICIPGECEADADINFPRRRRTIPCNKETPDKNGNRSETPGWLQKALKVWHYSTFLLQC